MNPSISQYLHWLARAQANSSINVLFKFPNGVKGYTRPLAEAVDLIAANANADAIWVSVHRLKHGVADKTKLAKADIEAYQYLAIDVDSRQAHAQKVCATDAERARTLAKADQISEYLTAVGLPRP